MYKWNKREKCRLKCECPRCDEYFFLVCEPEKIDEAHVEMRGCDSDPLYALFIVCPHCKVRLDLM